MHRRPRAHAAYKYELLSLVENGTSSRDSQQPDLKGLLVKMGLALVALTSLAVLSSYTAAQFGTTVDPNVLDACPGYKATNVKTTASSLTADLVLGGEGCNVFGEDIEKLSLVVTYETRTCPVHISI